MLLAWEPVQEGGENVLLGAEILNGTLNKTPSFPTERRLDQDFDVISSRSLPF